jgi:uncharacterized damage-inducible protein DinB
MPPYIESNFIKAHSQINYYLDRNKPNVFMRPGKTLFIAMMVTASFAGLSFKELPAPPSKAALMIADWERAKAYTLDYLNAANDEVIGFKPTPEMRTFGQQWLHVADDNYGFAALASGKKSPSDFGELEKKSSQYKTKAELTKVVMDSYDFTINALKEMDDARLNEVIKVFRWEISREATFQKSFEHQTHHRGQTTVYLRLKGIRPPEEKLF